jgi:hypothetical protein
VCRGVVWDVRSGFGTDFGVINYSDLDVGWSLSDTSDKGQIAQHVAQSVRRQRLLQSLSQWAAEHQEGATERWQSIFPADAAKVTTFRPAQLHVPEVLILPVRSLAAEVVQRQVWPSLWDGKLSPLVSVVLWGCSSAKSSSEHSLATVRRRFGSLRCEPRVRRLCLHPVTVSWLGQPEQWFRPRQCSCVRTVRD